MAERVDFDLNQIHQLTVFCVIRLRILEAIAERFHAIQLRAQVRSLEFLHRHNDLSHTLNMPLSGDDVIPW
jgi:hypothetical protein